MSHFIFNKLEKMKTRIYAAPAVKGLMALHNHTKLILDGNSNSASDLCIISKLFSIYNFITGNILFCGSRPESSHMLLILYSHSVH